MKKCRDCGVEYPDDAAQCLTCHTALVVPSASAQHDPKTEPVMSREEQRFWERMTFRQFTILFLKLQAVWLLFSAAVDVTYLPPYFTRFIQGSPYTARSSELSLGFFLGFYVLFYTLQQPLRSFSILHEL
jgi:hypothetical protein